MKRKKLADAVGLAARAVGYGFYAGFDYRMGETVISYPAVWLSPPRMAAVEGALQGRVRYRVSLQMMSLAGRATGEAKEQLWDILEADALKLYRHLASNPDISAVTVTECSPGEFSMTNHGEVSMNLKIDVELPFCVK